MKNAKEIISTLSDKDLKQAFLDIDESEKTRKDIPQESTVIKLAKEFRNNLNILEINTLRLSKDLIIREAAHRWSKTIE